MYIVINTYLYIYENISHCIDLNVLCNDNTRSRRSTRDAARVKITKKIGIRRIVFPPVKRQQFLLINTKRSPNINVADLRAGHAYLRAFECLITLLAGEQHHGSCVFVCYLSLLFSKIKIFWNLVRFSSATRLVFLDQMVSTWVLVSQRNNYRRWKARTQNAETRARMHYKFPDMSNYLLNERSPILMEVSRTYR